jgi:hypothetical protein
VKPLLTISTVVLLLAMLFFRVHSESGLTELQRCRIAVGQAKSWTVQVVSQPASPNFATLKNRTKVSCPDDYEVSYRSWRPDDVIAEQSTIHARGVTYVENVEGTWEKSANASDPPTLKECGKGPALVQSTVVTAIYELPRRKAGSIVKGQRQTIDGVGCQEWHVEYGNEWPQVAPYTICIDPKTHLPRRITFTESGATNDFTGWNSTTVEPPALGAPRGN